MTEKISFVPPQNGEAIERPRIIVMVAKCEMCPWETSISSTITQLATDGVKMGKLVDAHQLESGHSVRTFHKPSSLKI